MAERLTFQCCSCAGPIADDDIEPLQILVVEAAQWKSAADSRPEQPTRGLFAHVDCLRSRLHSGVPFLDHAQRRAGEKL